MMEEFRLLINGQTHTVMAQRNERLLDVLRDRLYLTGTKCGCNTGDCGTCRVIIDGIAVNSCLYQVGALEGKSITTVEGLATEHSIHPLQQAFIDAGAVQCGFCTPGMLISAKALLDENPNPSREDITKAIAPNLCRCTGYVKIIEAVELAVARMASQEEV